MNQNIRKYSKVATMLLLMGMSIGIMVLVVVLTLSAVEFFDADLMSFIPSGCSHKYDWI